ncbi:MAG: 2-C-methyl-D-erythritol 4-phosphate cytidylyltransferase [Actinomycetia bacterium]|nr:2-C-methyl-D-erythritol 4-phosphate cytidylyltransferase [Actinomycetes bacterium]
MKRNYCIIVAAGKSRRMNSTVSKQFIFIGGKPILAYTIDAFEKSSLIDKIVLVINEAEIEKCKKIIVNKYNYKKLMKIVPGGKERQNSVFNGLKVLPSETNLVAIHDGARFLITPDIIDRAVRDAYDSNGVIVAMPIQDTIKETNSNKIISKTFNRDRLWAAQTPQVFPYSIIMKAHEKAREDNFFGTDDASLVERLGYEVDIVRGSVENIKITTNFDLILAEIILNKRKIK